MGNGRVGRRGMGNGRVSRLSRTGSHFQSTFLSPRPPSLWLDSTCAEVFCNSIAICMVAKAHLLKIGVAHHLSVLRKEPMVRYADASYAHSAPTNPVHISPVNRIQHHVVRTSFPSALLISMLNPLQIITLPSPP